MILPIPTGLVRDIVARTLAEDLGGRGDITTLATIPADAVARFDIVSRADGILAGRQAAQEVLVQIDPSIDARWQRADGDPIRSGDVVAQLAGPARSLLSAERAALNFLGRMSGIATMTRAYVDAVDGSDTAIAHTRKTTPGLRALEIQAVIAGGGASHRYGLDDAILIKDNHVAVCGSVAEAVRRAKALAGHMTRVAVEIDQLHQLDDALIAGAESILLDNFSLESLRSAVAVAKGKATLEASGGVTLDTVRSIAETGVDVISVGALTHSAPNFDLGLDDV